MEGHGESREEFNGGRWEGEGWEKVPEGGRWKVGGKRVVCAHGLELTTLQTEAMVLKQSVVFSNVRERFY